MKAKYVKELLNCSYGTIAKYAKTGQLKLKKKLDGGFNDYDEESVYQLLGKMATPKRKTNFLLVVDVEGNRHEYFPDDVTVDQILTYLQEKMRNKMQ